MKKRGGVVMIATFGRRHKKVEKEKRRR